MPSKKTRKKTTRKRTTRKRTTRKRTTRKRRTRKRTTRKRRTRKRTTRKRTTRKRTTRKRTTRKKKQKGNGGKCVTPLISERMKPTQYLSHLTGPAIAAGLSHGVSYVTESSLLKSLKRLTSTLWNKESWDKESIKKSWKETELKLPMLQNKNLENWKIITKPSKNKKVSLPPSLQLRQDWGQFQKQKDIPWIPLNMVWYYTCRIKDVGDNWHNLSFAFNLVELTRQAIVSSCLNSITDEELNLKSKNNIPALLLNPVTQEPFSLIDIESMKKTYISSYKSLMKQYTFLEKLQKTVGTIKKISLYTMTFFSGVSYFTSYFQEYTPLISAAASAFIALEAGISVTRSYTENLSPFDVSEKKNILLSFRSLLTKSNIIRPYMGNSLYITIGGDAINILLNLKKLYTKGEDLPFSKKLGKEINIVEKQRKNLLKDIGELNYEEICTNIKSLFLTQN